MHPLALHAAAPEPEEHVPFLATRFGFLATFLGLLMLGTVIVTAAASAATFQGPTQAPPGGNIPTTVWNAESTGGQQTGASINIDGTVTTGSSTLDLGSGAGGQNVLYGAAAYANMNAADYLALLQTYSSGAYTDRFRIDKDGNGYVAGKLGVGTASPSQKVHIVSNAATAYIELEGNNGITYFGNDNLGNASFQSGTAGKDILFYNSAGGNPLMVIKNSGYIGMGGATNPTAPVQVGPNGGYGSTTGLVVGPDLPGSGYDRAYQIAPVQTGAAGGNSILMYMVPTIASGVTQPIMYGAFIDGKQGAGAVTSYAGLAMNWQNNNFGASNSTGILMGQLNPPTGNYGIYDATGNTNYFQGNVGIGTASPNQKLHVLSTAASAYIQLQGSSGTTYIGNDSSGNALLQAGNGGKDVLLSSSTGTVVTVKSSGKVGIGETGPTAFLQVKGDGSIEELRLDRNYPAASNGMLSFARQGSVHGYIGLNPSDQIILTDGATAAYTVSSINSIVSSKLTVTGGIVTAGGETTYSADTPISGVVQTSKLCLGDASTGNEAYCRTAWPTDIGSGTLAGQTLRWNGTSWVADSYLFNSATAVGINTTSPGAKLEVAGGGYNDSILLNSNNGVGTGISLKNTASGGHQYSLFSSGPSAGIGAGGFGIFDDTGSAYRLTISNNGGVGIADLTPADTFTVGSGSKFRVNANGNTQTAGTFKVTGHSAFGANSAIDDGSLLYPSSTFKNVISVQEQVSDISPDYVEGIASYLSLNPSSTPSYAAYGVDSEIETAPGNTQALVGVLNAGFFSASKNGTGTVSTAIGVDAAALNTATGSLESAYALTSGVSNYVGTITYGYGLFVRTANNDVPANFANNYGIYIQDQSSVGATSSYNLYSEGATAKNFFAGSVGIGDATPLSTFTVGSGDQFRVDGATGNVITNGTVKLGSLSGDPTGSNGLTYYSSATNRFRCYENGAWKNCITSPTTVNPGTVTGQTLVWNNGTTAWDPSSNLFNSGTNVGIGTTSPQSLLHVSGGNVSGVRIAVNSNFQHLIFASGASDKWSEYVTGNDLRFADSSSGIRLTLQDGGKVGIGTTAPTATLDVKPVAGLSGNSGVTNGFFQVEGLSYQDTQTAFSGTAPSFAFSAFQKPTLSALNTSTTTNAATVYIADAPGAGSGETITNPLALWVDDGTARFDGNVIINGTCTGCGAGYANSALSNLASVAVNTSLLPGTDNTIDLGSSSLRWKTLHVGPGSVVIHNDATDTAKLTVGFSGSTAQLVTNSATPLQLTTGTNSGINVDTSGNVGIGTASPGQKFHVVSGAASAYIELQGNNGITYFGNDTSGNASFQSGTAGKDIVFYNSAASVLATMKNTGELGIGDTSPAATLTVGNGDLFQVAGASGNVTTSGDVAVNGGDLTTSAGTFNLLQSGATAINFGGFAATITLGSGRSDQSIVGPGVVSLFDSGTNTLNLGGGASTIAIATGSGTVEIGTATSTGRLRIGGQEGLSESACTIYEGTGTLTCDGDLTTRGSNFNAAASTFTIAGTPTTLTIGSSASTFNIGPSGSSATTIAIAGGSGQTGCSIDGATGNLTCSGNIATTATTADLVNTTATTVNFGGAASTLNIGPGGFTATSINLAGGSSASGCTVDGATGNLTCSGDITVNGFDIKAGSAGTATVFDTNVGTVYMGSAAGNIHLGAATSTVHINDNLLVDTDITLGGVTKSAWPSLTETWTSCSVTGGSGTGWKTCTCSDSSYRMTGGFGYNCDQDPDEAWGQCATAPSSNTSFQAYYVDGGQTASLYVICSKVL